MGQNRDHENKNSTPMKRYLSLVMTDIPTIKYNEEKTKRKDQPRPEEHQQEHGEVDVVNAPGLNRGFSLVLSQDTTEFVPLAFVINK